jgi:hypothetical protein
MFNKYCMKRKFKQSGSTIPPKTTKLRKIFSSKIIEHKSYTYHIDTISSCDG